MQKKIWKTLYCLKNSGNLRLLDYYSSCAPGHNSVVIHTMIQNYAEAECIQWCVYSTVLCVFNAGDLKLVEKPQPIVMSPHDFTNIKASVKVASTENGIIFGNIGMFSRMNISFLALFVSEVLNYFSYMRKMLLVLNSECSSCLYRCLGMKCSCIH